MNKATTPSAETPVASTASDATGQMELSEAAHELLRYINGNHSLLSLLYDLDMMPEQLDRGTSKWINMLIIAAHFRDNASPVPEQPKSEGAPGVSGEAEFLTRTLVDTLDNKYAALRASHEELLEALKAATFYLPTQAHGTKDVLHPALSQARAAIKKAKAVANGVKISGK